ncbi:MAG: hypothetical protein ABIJ82_03115 [Patescibacteria group bacterium]|nr:hypothetical protein [Patescibacteria group bacterium]MBU1952956.1 hypothetical protein [Patescibacteria group bacterium]
MKPFVYTSKSKKRLITALVLIDSVLVALCFVFYTKTQNNDAGLTGSVLAAVDISMSAVETISASSEPATSTTIKSTSTPTPSPIPQPVQTPIVLGVSDATGEVFFGRGTPNNKIGMYVHNNADDIKAAAKLINSNGGDWGYILLTIDINDRNKSSWKDLFNAASSSHLIPIVQIFNNNNCNPDKLDFKGLASTLNSVKWPNKHRYISVFNEMNSKDYWCEKIAPDEYAKALNNAIKAFKDKSSDFFIMPGAFNSSARTQDRYMSEETYLVKMNEAVPGIFKKIDGWATHSYPQPNFSGDINNLPGGYGTRDTINNYEWEMQILRNYFGVGSLPIFITETGWLHREGQSGCVQYSQSNLLSADVVSSRYKIAYLNYWLKNPQIVAITPFIFRSKDPCAEGFAWQKKDGGWYPQANMLLNIAKTAGTP